MAEQGSKEGARGPSGHRWDRRYQAWPIGDPSERRVGQGSKARHWGTQASGGGAVAVGGHVACSPLAPLVVNRLAADLVREDVEESRMPLRC